MARTLVTRTQAVATRAAARSAVGTARITRAAAHFAMLAPAHGRGMAVRARVVASPEEWAITAIACDADTGVALLEHWDGLHCPVCGARYDKIPGAGVGPVEPEPV